MARVARQGGEVLNALVGGFSGVARHVGGVLCDVAALQGLLFEALEADAMLAALSAEAMWWARVEGAPALRRGKGRSRSKMGSPPETAACRRMLSWTKRPAAVGALAQRSRGIDGPG